MVEERTQKHENTKTGKQNLKVDEAKQEVKDDKGDGLQKKYDELEHKYKRALADYQNLLKRTAQEKVEFVKYANEDLIQAIIPVYDNLKLARTHVDLMRTNADLMRTNAEPGGPTRNQAGFNGWAEGLEHVIRQFKDVLESMGVEEIKTVGEKFDHNTMEAVEGRGEKVVKEVRSGYKLNGKVIVAAKVVVA